MKKNYPLSGYILANKKQVAQFYSALKHNIWLLNEKSFKSLPVF